MKSRMKIHASPEAGSGRLPSLYLRNIVLPWNVIRIGLNVLAAFAAAPRLTVRPIVYDLLRSLAWYVRGYSCNPFQGF
jgi:hypothetical protein